MCIRDRLYIGRAYERLVPPRSLYKKKIVSLPTPEFYTFYNLSLIHIYLVSEDYDSLGGFIIEHLDRLPEVGDEVCTDNGIRLIVEALEDVYKRQIIVRASILSAFE